LPLSSEARADQGCRKRRNQVPDWSEIRCRFPPKSPAAFDRNQVPVCSDFCRREWDSLIKPETSLIADLNSLQGRIIFVRMRRELASNRFGIEVIPAFRGEKVSERVAAE